MEKIKMTNNEYQEFLKVNANRIWTDENYSYKDYCKDAESVEVLPFDLSKYNLNEDIEKIINAAFIEDYFNKDGEYTLKGKYTDDEGFYNIACKLGLKVELWGYGGYCTGENNFYMTYCEGDLYLNLFEDKESYKRSLENTIKWYEENQ